MSESKSNTRSYSELTEFVSSEEVPPSKTRNITITTNSTASPPPTSHSIVRQDSSTSNTKTLKKKKKYKCVKHRKRMQTTAQVLIHVMPEPEDAKLATSSDDTTSTAKFGDIETIVDPETPILSRRVPSEICAPSIDPDTPILSRYVLSTSTIVDTETPMMSLRSVISNSPSNISKSPSNVSNPPSVISDSPSVRSQPDNAAQQMNIKRPRLEQRSSTTYMGEEWCVGRYGEPHRTFERDNTMEDRRIEDDKVVGGNRIPECFRVPLLELGLIRPDKVERNESHVERHIVNTAKKTIKPVPKSRRDMPSELGYTSTVLTNYKDKTDYVYRNGMRVRRELPQTPYCVGDFKLSRLYTMKPEGELDRARNQRAAKRTNTAPKRSWCENLGIFVEHCFNWRVLGCFI